VAGNTYPVLHLLERGFLTVTFIAGNARKSVDMASGHLRFDGNLILCMADHASFEFHAPGICMVARKYSFPFFMTNQAIPRLNVGQSFWRIGSATRKRKEEKNAGEGKDCNS
jgi:hypothetical protein